MYKKVIITTSRRPSPRTRSLVRDLTTVIPRSIRLTRGHTNYEELAALALSMGADRVIIVGTLRGNPSILRFYQPRPIKLVHLSSLIIKGLTLSREARTTFIPPKNFEEYKLYIKLTDTSPLSSQVAEILINSLGARLLAPGIFSSKKSVIVEISEFNNYSKIIFKIKDKIIGPKLKVIPTRRAVVKYE